MGQQIRPSQFITTYGPGAILEGPSGPRIIPSIRVLFGDNGRLPGQAANFEITEPRLASVLGASNPNPGVQVGIVRIPTNAELGERETAEVFYTEGFPTWSLCAQHDVLYQVRTSPCPQCPAAGGGAANSRARREAIRFVLACQEGHLDDVNWHRVVHSGGGRQQCLPSHYRWRGGGAALRFVTIDCPNCQASVNLGTAYSREWLCSGRFPEQLIPTNEPAARPGCAQPAKMIQKGAANLRMASLQAALTIPRLDTRLHHFLAQVNVRPVLIGSPPQSMNDLVRILTNLAQQGMIPPSAITMVQASPWQVVSDAIRDVINPALPTTYRQLLDQEFRELRNAAQYGAPAQQSSSPGHPPYFEVVQSAVIPRVRGPAGVEFRVAPVSRLRVVLVQEGYRRMDEAGTLVPVDYTDRTAQRVWFPGVEHFGEGLFIDIDPNGRQAGQFTPTGPEAAAWSAAWGGGRPPVQRDETHPVHVWWHTLAHRLLNALAVDSGYSAAAIRERVYTSVEPSGGATGGVLLYTVQPGGDGTLGGLITLAPRFASILRAAMRDDLACSNDPICEEERFDTDRVNGAACYGCLLVSETSCEHRNRWSDRNLLRANQP